MSMTGVGNVAEPRNNTRGAFSNTPTLWNQDWSGVVGFRPTDSRVQGEGSVQAELHARDDSLEREARQ